MSDYDSSLPIRTEADVDERVQVKIVDATDPNIQQEVDSDGNSHVEAHGNDPGGLDRALRTSELGHASMDGEYHASNNTDPSNIGILAHVRNASPADSQQTERLTSVENVAGDTRSLDVSLHDEAGEPYSQTNPLPVAFAESEGDEIANYQTSAAVASDASVDHDYTVTAAKTFLGRSAWVSGSGKLKVELKLETAAASGVYNTVFVGFNSTGNPNVSLDIGTLKQVTGAKVRISITNRDNQAQDLYSTLSGIER